MYITIIAIRAKIAHKIACNTNTLGLSKFFSNIEITNISGIYPIIVAMLKYLNDIVVNPAA